MAWLVNNGKKIAFQDHSRIPTVGELGFRGKGGEEKRERGMVVRVLRIRYLIFLSLRVKGRRLLLAYSALCT